MHRKIVDRYNIPPAGSAEDCIVSAVTGGCTHYLADDKIQVVIV